MADNNFYIYVGVYTKYLQVEFFKQNFVIVLDTPPSFQVYTIIRTNTYIQNHYISMNEWQLIDSLDADCSNY